jgi:hypothetical protein
MRTRTYTAAAPRLDWKALLLGIAISIASFPLWH